MGMIKDKFILATLAAIIANILGIILNYCSYLLNINEYLLWKIAASAFVPLNKIDAPPAIFIGLVADFIVAISLGIFILIILNLTGVDYAIVKGILSGLFFWLMLFAILFNAGIVKLIPQDPASYVGHIIDHSIRGSVIGWILQSYGKQFFVKN